MFVLELEGNKIFDRPIEEVFAYMDDIENEHEWLPYLRQWEQSPNPVQRSYSRLNHDFQAFSQPGNFKGLFVFYQREAVGN